MHANSGVQMRQTDISSRRIGRLGPSILLAIVLSGPWARIGWSQHVNSLVEPGAGTWRTWVLSSGSDLRIPAPPGWTQTSAEIEFLRMLSGKRDAAALDRISYWDTGAPGQRWNEIALSQASLINAPRGLRAMTLLNVAIYDATIAAWDSKYTYYRPRPSELDPTVGAMLPTPRSPSYPSEHAVVAGAASAILSYLFPAGAQSYADLAREAAQSRLDAGVQYPSDTDAGLELGRQVGLKVIARAQTDGSDAVWSGTVPPGPGKWNGTNPVEPLAGNWKTWTVTSGNQFRPGPPPAYDSAQEKADLDEVKNYARTVATNFAAWFWQPQAITLYTPVVHQKIFEYRLDSNPPRAARIQALVNIAAYDAGTAVWDAKYAYWAIRPVQLDPAVTTLFPTPPHPSYPSAHSGVIGSVMATLAYLFPRDADYFNARADECASARMWAGIHFTTDNTTGKELGRAVAQIVVSRAKSDGADTQ
jgi:membrane-associated phospholipid phosphatase